MSELGRGRYELLTTAEIRDDQGKVILNLADEDTSAIRGLYPTDHSYGEIAGIVLISNAILNEQTIREAKRTCRQAALEHLREDE